MTFSELAKQQCFWVGQPFPTAGWARDCRQGQGQVSSLCEPTQKTLARTSDLAIIE
jgi:hypothetical protein